MGRWIGVDYGSRRIGLALSDPAGRIASPMEALDGTGAAADDARLVLRWAAENDATAVVVGMPLNMDGSVGLQARLCAAFAEQLRALGTVPVELWDERLTSFQADLTMRAAGLSRAKQRKHRDALAAQVMLQSFLDARRISSETS